MDVQDSVRDAVVPEKLWENLLRKYKEAWDWYEKWVRQHPETVSNVERTFRIVSYLLSGAGDDDQVLAELVFSLSNLLVFFNDGILRRASSIFRTQLSLSQQQLMRWLTVIDHVEVFVELAAARMWGEIGRWVVIAIIQLMRSLLRLFLLYRYKAGIQPNPPFPPLNREKVVKTQEQENSMSSPQRGKSQLETKENRPESTNAAGDNRPEVTFVGQRSGRIVRTLKSAPDLTQRTWKLPNTQEKDPEDVPVENLLPSELLGLPLTGECIHISRPLAHLAALLLWGQYSWKPWLLSFTLDVASIKLLDQSTQYNRQEKAELKKRTFLLLFYLLRSPCFDKYTRTRLLGMMEKFGNTVPGMGFIMKSMMEYLPVWQRIYFYTWSH
ncbi:peroxisomal membrane protein PEX16-like [Amphiura filiformis]|uniref:peroxisomal membrane protein PEX16-like n=1 Tax=Amphiura filiformis TaxID=82378 RepID=UPI003B22340E